MTWSHGIYSGGIEKGLNNIVKGSRVAKEQKGGKMAELTPPVRPNILSRSGGVSTSLPTTSCLNPGAYSSMQSNTACA